MTTLPTPKYTHCYWVLTATTIHPWKQQSQSPKNWISPENGANALLDGLACWIKAVCLWWGEWGKVKRVKCNHNFCELGNKTTLYINAFNVPICTTFVYTVWCNVYTKIMLVEITHYILPHCSLKYCLTCCWSWLRDQTRFWLDIRYYKQDTFVWNL